MNEWINECLFISVSFYVDKYRVRLNWKLFVQSECCKRKVIHTKQIYLKCNLYFYISLSPLLKPRSIKGQFTSEERLLKFRNSEKKEIWQRRCRQVFWNIYTHIIILLFKLFYLCNCLLDKSTRRNQQERQSSIWEKKNCISFPEPEKFWFILLWLKVSN